MNIRRTAALTLAAVCLIGAGSCQKTYQMVPPPSANSGDGDLDDEDFWGDKNRTVFVTPYGEGELDGTSWDNAFDADTFISMLSDQTDLSKTDVYLSEGTYCMSSGPVFGPEIRKDIKSVNGGYSIDSKGNDLTKRSTSEYATVFSGDMNKNGKADEGDCGLLSVFSGHSTFNGITFRHGYINETTASAKKSSAGIRVEGSGDTWAEFVGCKFEDCVNAATNNSYGGGAAVYVVSGQARLKNCELSGCSGTSRGGAIRCTAADAVVLLDRCSIHDNHVSGDWGTGVQMSGGTVCINNTTVCGNTAGGSGGAINGGGAMLILNSTVISNDNTAGIRCESGAGQGSFIANSISVNLKGKPGFLLNGAGKVAVSGGHNIFSSTSGALQSSASDMLRDEGWSENLEDGVYVWDWSKVTPGSWATAAELEGYAREFDPSTCRGIGAVFADWCDGFAVDQRGNARNSAKLLPGAYDPKLDGEASKAVRLQASATGFSGSSARNLDEFGFVLTAPEEAYSYIKKIVRNGDEYLTDNGETMLWYDGQVSIAAFAPWSEVAGGTVAVNCPASQKAASDLETADFVIWKGTVDPKKDLPSDGKLKFTLGHINTRIIVKVTANGVPVETSGIESLSIGGLKRTGKCSLADAAPAVIADGDASVMYPYAGTGSYELVTVPQTVAAGEFSVKASYGKRQYVWTSAAEVTLQAGKTAEVTVNLVTTKSSAANEMTITIR